MNFYDFKVFKYDWMVVIINPVHKTKEVIVNDRDKLVDYYNKHKNEIWIGWKSSRYDKIILKSILLGFNPKAINDCLILHNYAEWQIDSRLKNIKLLDYDVKFSKSIGLKQVEGFMGNSIEETSVPFDIDRKLTEDELERTIGYCTHNVEQTMEIFLRKQDNFNAYMELIREFSLPLDFISLTKARLVSAIVRGRKRQYNDENEVFLPDTLLIEKYKNVIDWFLDRKNMFGNSELNCEIAGVPHKVAWGGLHGAREKYNCEGMIIHLDVNQMYPHTMIRYGLLSRSCRDREKYNVLVEKSMRLKEAGELERRKPYKGFSNIMYGAMQDESNPLYDPRNSRLVCVYAQLFMVDLLEKLEPFAEVIQSNTDGLFVKISESDFDRLDDVVYEWEERTGLTMDFKHFKRIVQKDVNNYIAVREDGSLKRKGLYVKELSDIDNDLPIVNEAVVRCLVNGTSPQKTIEECTDLKMFQKIVKLTNTYKCAHHNGKRLEGTVFRVFASRDVTDSQISKMKDFYGKKEKFASTPAKCFIDNGEVKGRKVPFKLDRWWYIDLAVKRIEDFGVEAKVDKQQELF